MAAAQWSTTRRVEGAFFGGQPRPRRGRGLRVKAVRAPFRWLRRVLPAGFSRRPVQVPHTSALQERLQLLSAWRWASQQARPRRCSPLCCSSCRRATGRTASCSLLRFWTRAGLLSPSLVRGVGERVTPRTPLLTLPFCSESLGTAFTPARMDVSGNIEVRATPRGCLLRAPDGRPRRSGLQRAFQLNQRAAQSCST